MSTSDYWRNAALFGLAGLVCSLYIAIDAAPVPGDARLAGWVQDIEILREIEGPINAAGTFRAHVVVLLVAAIAVIAGMGGAVKRGERNAALGALIGAGLLRMFNRILKEATQSPRPSEDYGVDILGSFHGYGFPSGHVYGDVVVYGVIALLAPIIVGARSALVLRIACFALVVLAGPARVVVGAHWPSDVVGGYIWGMAALALAAAAGRRVAGLR